MWISVCGYSTAEVKPSKLLNMIVPTWRRLWRQMQATVHRQPISCSYSRVINRASQLHHDFRNKSHAGALYRKRRQCSWGSSTTRSRRLPTRVPTASQGSPKLVSLDTPYPAPKVFAAIKVDPKTSLVLQPPRPLALDYYPDSNRAGNGAKELWVALARTGGLAQMSCYSCSSHHPLFLSHRILTSRHHP